MSSKAAKIVVSGLVQGVGYRYFVYRQAVALGLVGQTKNRTDGTVEVLVEGEASLIEELIDQLRIGPAHASVAEVSSEWLPPTMKFETFSIESW